ncbi:MAG: hypothetical protein KVP17_003095 [Porospora cf. gigantea B]|uniref:uncharacterized protein n=1 Tax=Porospora cf. gigantea B TaxID=2853592 RepID=UPI0035717AED|nr:MAG: hypothetical protein KVP17_003095 [Porospora cf. gigantea B]
MICLASLLVVLCSAVRPQGYYYHGFDRQRLKTLHGYQKLGRFFSDPSNLCESESASDQRVDAQGLVALLQALTAFEDRFDFRHPERLDFELCDPECHPASGPFSTRQAQRIRAEVRGYSNPLVVGHSPALSMVTRHVENRLAKLNVCLGRYHQADFRRQADDIREDWSVQHLIYKDKAQHLTRMFPMCTSAGVYWMPSVQIGNALSRRNPGLVLDALVGQCLPQEARALLHHFVGQDPTLRRWLVELAGSLDDPLSMGRTLTSRSRIEKDLWKKNHYLYCKSYQQLEAVSRELQGYVVDWDSLRVDDDTCNAMVVEAPRIPPEVYAEAEELPALETRARELPPEKPVTYERREMPPAGIPESPVRRNDHLTVNCHLQLGNLFRLSDVKCLLRVSPRVQL